MDDESKPLIPKLKADRNYKTVSEQNTVDKAVDNAVNKAVDNAVDKYMYKRSKCLYVVTFLFYILCFLTGQYIASPALYDGIPHAHAVFWTVVIYICNSLFLAAGVLLNLFSLAFDLFVISACRFEYCGFLYTNTTNIIISNLTHLIQSSPPPIGQFDDWQKVVFTTATVSGVCSYFVMICVLYGQYSCFNKCRGRMPTMGSVCCLIAKEPHHHTVLRTGENGTDIKYAINPFFDKEYTYQVEDKDQSGPESPDTKFLSALITPEQSGYFQLIFWINFLIYTSSVVLFFILLAGRIDSDGSVLEVIDIIGLVGQFVSQFCAILSCFIFSKVAYAVSNRCLDFSKCIFPQVDIPKNEGNEWVHLIDRYFKNDDNPEAVSHLMILKKMDQVYAKIVKNSLGPYGTWFAIHWVLYTVTAFMSIAYVADIIEMELYTPEKCHYEGTVDCRLALSYSICFALEHCVLFLYPCFRAASVTKARSSLIKSVSKAEWRNVPPEDKNAFVAYLKDQNCNFKVSILCANLSFGFNMAYISIFIGILGVILKIST